VPVVRPKVIETTALGSAYAAGLAVGFWGGTEELVRNWAVDKRWKPAMDDADRLRLRTGWAKAVARAVDWV
jgi:glycerol kinase